MKSANSSPLTLERLEIRQFAGVNAETAFTLHGFSPEINIIYGPNGCGKTTTARAIQQLIWPKAFDGYQDVNAVFEQEGARWSLQDRGSRVEVLKEGVQIPHPAWASSDTRSRYHWSLQNLLQDQDRDLAGNIAREMAGGIDFQEISTALNLHKKPTAPLKLHQQYLEAEKRVREAKEKQQDVKRESDKLDQLEQELQSTIKRYAQEEFLKSAIEWVEKREEMQILQEKMAEAPPGMEVLRADDAEEVQKNLLKRTELEETSRALQIKSRELGSGEERWVMFDANAFRNARKEMQAHLDQMKEARDEIRLAQTKVVEAESREQDLRAKLGLNTQASLQLEDGYHFPELQEWIQEVFSEIEWAERIKVLQTNLPEETEMLPFPDLDILREARQILGTWRKNQTSPSPQTQIGFLASMVLFAGGMSWLVLENILPWISLLLLVPPPLLHFLFGRKKHQTAIYELQESYAILEAPQPTAWQETQVKETLRELDDAVRKAHRESLLEIDRRRLDDAEVEHGKVKDRICALQQELSTMGFEPHADKALLAHFLENVQRWRMCRTETAVAESSLHKLERDLQEIEQNLKTLLQEWGEVQNTLSLKSSTENCLERMERELDRRKQVELLEIQRKQNEEQLTEKIQILEDICKRIGLSEPNLAEVKHRVEYLESWKQNLRKSEILQSRISELEESLANHLPLIQHPKEHLQLQLQSCVEARETELQIRDRMSKLEQQIHDQQRSRGLHEAQETLAECRESLERERDIHLEVRLGMEIVDWLRDRCKTRDQSAALEEANRYLVLFSRGTLKLEVSIHEKEGGFLARREGRPALSLHKLSSGERSQVLMAVRLAFLSQVEQVPLPLLVDEALGTTDDERGNEIMRSLIEVSRQGRQLFYFTAQQDEVDKWRGMLDAESVEAAFIDLAAERGFAEHLTLPPYIPVEKTPVNYKQQSEESLEAWAKRLHIPGWEPHQSLDRLSLWFLIFDRPDLLQNLFERGIDRIGKWTLYEESGATRGWVGENDRRNLSLKTNIFRTAQKYWKIGRPPPVPETFIAESPAVSDTFADSVLQLLKESNGEAHQLIAKLDQGETKGFRQNKIRDLEQELREQGFLSEEIPLQRDEWIAKLMGEIDSADHSMINWDVLSGLFFKNG